MACSTVPSILIFMLDDVGPADLAAVSTPALDSLRAVGLEFTKAYGAPICSPARRMLHLGEWYTRQSAEAAGQEPPSSAEWLAELCAEHASCVIGKWHLHYNPSGAEPQGHGWGNWLGGISKTVSPNYDNWSGFSDGVGLSETQYLPGYQADRFKEWWTETAGPKLCFYGPSLAHSTGNPPTWHRPPASWLPPGYPTTPTPRSKFEAMIVAADLQLSKALEHVDLEDTIVVVCGDNGTPADQMPDVTGDGIPDPDRGKTRIYERGIRIPLVIAGPGVSQGVSDALVHLVDVRATVADLATGQIPSGDGCSLRPILEDPDAPSPRTYLLTGVEGDPRWPNQVAVVHKRYKYHWIEEDSVVTERLFDLTADPLELTNLIDNPAHALAQQGLKNFYAAHRP